MTLKGKTIFLLEDDPVNFSIILTILRREGASTIHDYWGDTTLRNLRSFDVQIDLILLDIMLPNDITGYDVFDAIRADAVFDQVPIVAVSASDPDMEIPKAQAKGFHGYISKPINRRTFPNQLSEILAGKEIWD